MKVKIEIDLFYGRLVQYQALAQKTGRSLEELFQEALGQYLELNSSKQAKMADLTAITRQVANLQTRLQVLEQKQKISPALPDGSLNRLTTDDYEEWEDEPDEVLENFLPQVF